MKATRRKPSFGTVSHGTMRSQDLLPEFLDTLRYYAPRAAAQILRDYPEFIAYATDHMPAPYLPGDVPADDAEFWTSESADYMLDALQTALDAVANRVPFCYFGATDGDGSDFGFWPIDLGSSRRDLEPNGVLAWCDDSRNPTRAEIDGYTHYVRFSDHGNVTLFARNHREVWTIV